MTHDQIRAARRRLGLTVKQMAALLDTDDLSIRRLEMHPDRATARKPAPRMLRLIAAYLDGYRPVDWPLEDYP
jgi:DNA-binding transcriptional regulator YiaG